MLNVAKHLAHEREDGMGMGGGFDAGGQILRFAQDDMGRSRLSRRGEICIA
jgi:hypothetical protein